MNNTALTIAILFGTILLLILLICIALIYRKKAGKNDPKSFVEAFPEILYRALFNNRYPEDVAADFGINAEQYEANCKTVGWRPDLKKLVIHQVYGIILLVIGGILMLTVNLYFGFAVALLSLVFLSFEKRRLKSKAAEQRIIMSNLLPDFLDLLKTELVVGIPVEIAIANICERKDDLLSREFMRTIQTMQLGAADWGTALDELAERYNINTLTEFVLEVTTAYRNGTDIADTIIKKASDIRKIHILTIKEAAGKTTNTVLLPMTFLQIVPMVVFLMIPAIVITTQGSW